MNIFSDNSMSIGKTPLVKINNISHGLKATIIAKIEGRNPSSSVKCRVGAAMIWDAEKKGLLKSGVEIIEATSGNTGIALAFVAAARGYKLTLAMPNKMSNERSKILGILGAKIILTDTEKYMEGSIQKVREIVAEDPNRYFMPMQFENPANPAIHETTTAVEIWDDTDGNIDAIVAGIGTGGTISGISRYLKKTMSKNIISIGVEPKKSPVISQKMKGKRQTPRFHGIQGIGAGFIPKNLDLDLLDFMEQVEMEDSVKMVHRLAKEEGILCGISGGAAMVAALRVAKRTSSVGKTVVVILPDTSERYLTTDIFN